MPFAHPGSRCTALALVLAAGTSALAAPVSGLQAQRAAMVWLQRTPAPLGATLSPDVAGVTSHADAKGRLLYHEVRLAPEGFLILAADDTLEPVIAFSDQGALDPDPDSHLSLMLALDLGARLDRADPMAASASAARSRWAQLLEPAAGAMSISTVADVRVAPLLASKWNQATAGGYNVYNYFTPNTYVCGCVATAMAQLMRFHQYPTAGIGVKAFQVGVDNATLTLNTRGGDGLGGPYGWASMPLVPSAASSDAERQMIGALCLDAGLSVNMDYAAAGSGADMAECSGAFLGTFKYANAIHGSVGGELTGHGLTEMVDPDLDAGFPVLFGITGTGGHSIVCDGYGYNTGTLYHHLNLGWGGASNAWYDLPDIGTNYNFYLIDECVYNVFVTGSGEILSGRTLNAAGSPLAGIQVTNGALTATSNAQGIYALKGLSGGVATISAGSGFPQAVRIVGTSTDGPSVGNVWGVDLVQGSGATPAVLPQPQDQEAKLGGSATFTAGATGQGPLHFQWTLNGAAVGTDAPVYTLAAAPAEDDLAAVAVRVTGAHGTADSAPATLHVMRLYNGDFEHGNQGWNLWDPTVVLGAGYYPEVVPHGGGGWLCIGDWSQPTVDYAMQDLELPAGQVANLSFWAGIGNRTATPSTPTNIFHVKVLDTGGHTLATLQTLDNTQAQKATDGTVVWKPYGPLDLTPWAGQTVRLRLEATQPGGADTGTFFAVDDLVLAVSVIAPKAALAPGAPTLATGGTWPFKAAVTGYKADNRVDWTVTGAAGAFNPARTPGDGATPALFTAGSNPGTFTVTATPVEVYPGTTAASTSVTLVDPAAVTVTLAPAAPTVALGQAVTLTPAVGLLSDPTVTWTASGGVFTGVPGTAATWSSSAAGTFTVTATSVGAPSRSATARITVLDPAGLALAVTPSSATLLSGASAAFTAAGDLGAGVNWSLAPTAGHADQGLTTTVTLPSAALLATATWTLTATSTLDPTRRATAVLTVKGLDLVPDGLLDPRDLLALAAEWGKGPSSPANFKGSGTVDETDLATLMTQLQ